MSDTNPPKELDPAPMTSSGGVSPLLIIIPLLLIVAAGYVGYIYYSSMSDPNEGIVKNEPVDDTPRTIGPGGMQAMPSFGDLDIGDFNVEAMEESFAQITDGFVDLNADNVGEFVDTINGLTESIPDMGLDKLSDNAAMPVNQFLTGFSGNVREKMGQIDDDNISEQVDPALTAMWDKLKEYSFPREIKMIVEHIYDLAALQQGQLDKDRMTGFVERTSEILGKLGGSSILTGGEAPADSESKPTIEV